MKNQVFLKVFTLDGAQQLVALPNQYHEVNGKKEKISTTTAVLTRDVTVELSAGECWATDGLALTQNNWYVVGVDLYLVTDDLGIIRSTFTDKKHEAYCDGYRKYKTGAPAEAVEKKSKPKRSLMDRLQRDRTLRPPTIEDDGWYVDKDLWYYLVRSIKKRKNILLIGPSGAGKTELVRIMMSKVSKELNIFDMAVTNPNKTFCGNLRAENGSTYFQLSRFAQVIQEEGMVLMDELSRAAPTANNIFLPLLDKRRTLYIEDAINEEERMINVHEGCAFWATANIGSEFVGTMTLDHALMNRFQPKALTYPPKEQESLLLQKIYGLDAYTSDALASIAVSIRTNPELSKDISTRQLFDVAELIADGYSPIKAFEWGVLDQFEDNLHDGGEKATVKTILQAL